MKVLFVAGFGPISADVSAARQFYGEVLAPLANELVLKPLSELDRHADSGLITGSELLELPPSRDENDDETSIA